MAYLASKVITNAFYLSKIVSRSFETPTGPQMADGLDTLNKILVDKTIQSALIPYVQKIQMSAVIGQSEYFIENLIDLDTFTFFIGTIRFATQRIARDEWFGNNRATGIKSLPFTWHLERELNGARIYLYFVPDQAYTLELVGTFRLANVTQQQDLTLSLDQYYIDFLEYALAVRLCEVYGFNVPPSIDARYEKYMKLIQDQMKVFDLTQQKLSYFGQNGSFVNYAIASLNLTWWAN